MQIIGSAGSDNARLGLGGAASLYAYDQTFITTRPGDDLFAAYTFENSSGFTTSCPSFKTTITGHSQVGATAYVFRQAHYAKNSSSTPVKYGGIDCISGATDVGVHTGILAFNCAISGTSSTMLEINGKENQINAYKPLDMNGNNIVTSTGSLTINASGSTGAGSTGSISMTPRVGGYIIMNNLPTSATGLPSGALWNNSGVLNIAP